MINIMIVDDFRIFITQLKKLGIWKKHSDLLEIRYTVTDSRRALELLRNEKVDILITDIRMPELSGIDLLRIAANEKLCRCSILMSEFAEFEYAHEALKLGAFDYLVKPVTDSMMEPVIERAVRYLSESPDSRYDEIIESSIEAVCSCIINSDDSFREKLETLVSSCTYRSGKNLVRHRISLEKTYSEIFTRMHSVFPWIANVVRGPETFSRTVMNYSSRETAEEIFTVFCSDIFSAVRSFYPRKVSDLTRNVADYILNNYSQKLLLADVAEACFTNRTHLSHVFKLNMGISFVDYIIKYKMQILTLMISQTDMTLSEIAEKLGYDESKYMGRLFKNTYGITISEYRKKYMSCTAAK